MKTMTAQAHARTVLQHESEMIDPEKLETLTRVADLIRSQGVDAERLFAEAMAADEIAPPDSLIASADAVYVAALVLLS